MEPMSQIRKMREQFRVSIRRQKKEEIFRSLRNKNRVVFIEQQQCKMMNELDTQEKREEWVLRKSRELAGQPDSSWRFIMNQLFWSMLSFKGKGCFKIWIESGIIKSICTLFYDDYRSLNLGPDAAKLLGNIIYLQEEQEEQKTSLVAQEIFNQEIMENVIEMIADHTFPHSEVSFLVTLIGNMAHNDIGPVVKKGGLKVCIDWSWRMLRQKKINRAYLEQIYSFFEMLSNKIQKIPTNYNYVSQVFKVFTEYIEIDQSNELISRILSTIIVILSDIKQAVYTLLLENTKLMNRFFNLSTCEHERIRQQCWKIFGYLSSAQKVKEVFLNFYFLDIMWNAYGIEPLPNGAFDRITENMLICISNVASENDDMREQILAHPAINIVYDSTHEQRSTNLKKSAYFTLCTFLSSNNYNLCKHIRQSTPIFEKLVLGLDHMIEKDSRTIKDILRHLSIAIKADSQVYRYHDVSLLNILDSKYNLSTILNKIQEVYPENHKIARYCNEIFDLSSTN